MLTPEEFVVRWGNLDELVRFDSVIVNSLPIPMKSKRFLIEAGLPRDMGTLHFGFPSNLLPPAPEMISGFDLPEEYARYRLLGADKGVYNPEICTSLCCLDEQERGKIVTIGNPRTVKDGITYIDTETYVVSPLNTNVAYLAEMLLLIEEDQRWRAQLPEDYDIVAAYAHYKEVGRAMRKVDRTALRGKQGWHGYILAAEHGF